MNTTEFASELGTDARTARKFLRSVTPKDEQPGKGSRWDLPNGKREMNRMKKQFSEWRTAQDAKNQVDEADASDTDDEDADNS